MGRDGPQTVRVFEGHTGRVNAVALSPDGKTVYSGSADYTIRAWNTETGTVRLAAARPPAVADTSPVMCAGHLACRVFLRVCFAFPSCCGAACMAESRRHV